MDSRAFTADSREEWIYETTQQKANRERFESFFKALVTSRPSMYARRRGNISTTRPEHYLFVSQKPKRKVKPPRPTIKPRMRRLLKLQDKNGGWKDTPEFRQLLGVRGVLPEPAAGVVMWRWCTALAIAFIRRHPEHFLATDEVVKKALEWANLPESVCAKAARALPRPEVQVLDLDMEKVETGAWEEAMRDLHGQGGYLNFIGLRYHERDLEKAWVEGDEERLQEMEGIPSPARRRALTAPPATIETGGAGSRAGTAGAVAPPRSPEGARPTTTSGASVSFAQGTRGGDGEHGAGAAAGEGPSRPGTRGTDATGLTAATGATGATAGSGATDMSDSKIPDSVLMEGAPKHARTAAEKRLQHLTQRQNELLQVEWNWAAKGREKRFEIGEMVLVGVRRPTRLGKAAPSRKLHVARVVFVHPDGMADVRFDDGDREVERRLERKWIVRAGDSRKRVPPKVDMTPTVVDVAAEEAAQREAELDAASEASGTPRSASERFRSLKGDIPEYLKADGGRKKAYTPLSKSLRITDPLTPIKDKPTMWERRSHILQDRWSAGPDAEAVQAAAETTTPKLARDVGGLEAFAKEIASPKPNWDLRHNLIPHQGAAWHVTPALDKPRPSARALQALGTTAAASPVRFAGAGTRSIDGSPSRPSTAPVVAGASMPPGSAGSPTRSRRRKQPAPPPLDLEAVLKAGPSMHGITGVVNAPTEDDKALEERALGLIVKYETCLARVRRHVVGNAETYVTAPTNRDKQAAFDETTAAIRETRSVTLDMVEAVWEWERRKSADAAIMRGLGKWEGEQQALTAEQLEDGWEEEAEPEVREEAYVPWIWKGTALLPQVVSGLDFLAYAPALQDWYGGAYPFWHNPFGFWGAVEGRPSTPRSPRRWVLMDGVRIKQVVPSLQEAHDSATAALEEFYAQGVECPPWWPCASMPHAERARVRVAETRLLFACRAVSQQAAKALPPPRPKTRGTRRTRSGAA